ncbi:MAG: zinc-ribbon domain-containing protein [Eggerthellaceae bacterium]|nr:zinc-ribbon domain-containing protein [Eggerthellaceae bacterium]
MRCPQCGRTVENEGAAFCPKCGVGLVADEPGASEPAAGSQEYFDGALAQDLQQDSSQATDSASAAPADPGAPFKSAAPVAATGQAVAAEGAQPQARTVFADQQSQVAAIQQQPQAAAIQQQQSPAAYSQPQGQQSPNLYGQSGQIQPGVQATGAPYDPALAANAPFLAMWQTQGGYTALGILAAIGISVFSNILSGTGVLSIVGSIIQIGVLAFSIYYALAMYPSLFTSSPKATSVNAVSFLNGFVGGIIFGLIWNSNLTKRYKGISNIVFVVFNCVVFVAAFFFGIALVGMVVGSAGQM